MNIFLLLVTLVIALFSLQLGISKSTPKISQTNVIQKEATNEATVSHVVDGDTIKISTGQTIRFIGIDTPELHHPKKSVQCFGKEAKDETTKLIFGKHVRLEKDVSEKDRYGRLLRYVYVDGKMINEVLVKQGYARINTFPPDVKYANLFLLAQKEAQNQNRGLWKSCINIPKQ